MVDMREIEHIFDKLNYELAKDENFCSGTIIQKAVKNTKIEFFQNSLDQYSNIKHISELLQNDIRFQYIHHASNIQGMRPAEDAKFFRGCIKLSTQ